MVKASEELVRFLKEHYSEEKLASFFPLTRDSIVDLYEDIAINFEYSLVYDQEDGKKIDENLLDTATRVGDELRERPLDLKDLAERLKSSKLDSK